MKHLKTFESFDSFKSNEIIEEGLFTMSTEKAIEKGKKVIFGDDKLPGWELGKTWQRYDKKWVLNSAAKTYKDNISPDIESGKLPKEAKDKYFDYVGRNDVPGAKFFVTYDAEAKGTDGTPGLFKSATSNKEGKTGLR